MQKKPEIVEFRITAEDKIGLIKDISSIISRSHINIQNLNTVDIGRQSIIKIHCGINKEKAEKLILKLKKIKEIKEIGYKILKS